jgi:hypothetical protein
MWEVTDIIVTVGLAALGAITIGALLYLDARNRARSGTRWPH